MNALTPFLPSERSKGFQALLKKLEALHVNSQSLCAGLHPIILEEVSKNIALVNNYYSNFIESEGTHPVDITRAMQQDFSHDRTEEKKQRLALAYQETQEFIWDLPTKHNFSEPDSIKEIHQRFYGSKVLLAEQLIIEDTSGKQHPVIPGRLRSLDVQIGQHIAPSPDTVNELLQTFSKHYQQNESDLIIYKLLKAFAAHHRYMYIHPFLDGNGRTGRLMTDGMLKQALPESYGLWSLSRGLARQNDDYKMHLARADQIRQGVTDGRGQRSESGLIEFIDFMTSTAIDQVSFMKGMLKLDSLSDRMKKYIAYSPDNIPEEFEKILPELMIYGEIKKSALPAILNCSERKARDIAKTLKELELISDTGKFAPYRLQLSSKMLSFIFPDLIPFKD